MKCRILVLEDNLERVKKMKQNWWGCTIDHVETVHEFEHMFDTKTYDIICLDHDLGGLTYVSSDSDVPTGYHAACYMADVKDKKPKDYDPFVAIHSFNPEGAQRIWHVLRKVGYRASKIPCIWSLRFNFDEIQTKNISL